MSPSAEPGAYALQAINSFDSGVIAADAAGVVALANPAAARHLQIEGGILTPGASLTAVAGAEALAAVFDEIRADGRPVLRRELAVSGGALIGLSATLLEGPDAFNGVLFLFTDMTERKRMERAAELTRQLAALGELTAGVVHELRTPVTVISGMAELLQRRVPPGSPAAESAETIVGECGGLESLINQLLGFAKPFDVVPARCAPGEIVERAVALCLKKAQTRGAELHQAIDPEAAAIRADAGKMVQVLVNLINNAIDAVPEETGRIDVRCAAEPGAAIFEVADNGPGIRPPEGEDIFRPFFTQKEDGTGLGLSIVSRIVHAHGGAVSYRDGAPGGARFIIRLPQPD